jgi:phage FluMu protein Com
MSAGIEVGFCPRCQVTRTLRSVDTMALKRSAGGTHLVRRRQLECTSCNTFLSMVETAIRTEVLAGSA